MKKSDVIDQNVVVATEVVELTIEQQIAELNAKKLALKEEAKALKEKMMQEKVQLASEKAELKAKKIAELLQNQACFKENKTERIQKLLMEGKSNAQIKEETGYETKFICDTVWRIEKRLGMR